MCGPAFTRTQRMLRAKAPTSEGLDTVMAGHDPLSHPNPRMHWGGQGCPFLQWVEALVTFSRTPWWAFT